MAARRDWTGPSAAVRVPAPALCWWDKAAAEKQATSINERGSVASHWLNSSPDQNLSRENSLYPNCTHHHNAAFFALLATIRINNLRAVNTAQ